MRARGRAEMVAGMAPELGEGCFVFATAGPGREGDLARRAVATMREAEGLSVVLPAEVAEAHGLAAGPPMRRITLGVHSALDGVGLTAAVSGALAEAGIACNVVAGHHHDHLFVPASRAEEAVAVLGALAAAEGAA